MWDKLLCLLCLRPIISLLPFNCSNVFSSEKKTVQIIEKKNCPNLREKKNHPNLELSKIYWREINSHGSQRMSLLTILKSINFYVAKRGLREGGRGLEKRAYRRAEIVAFLHSGAGVRKRFQLNLKFQSGHQF